MSKNVAKRLCAWAVVVVLTLLLPLVLTIRNGGVEGVGWNWSPGDFVFMAILLFGSATAYELLARKMGSGTYRVAVGVAVIAAVLLVWINAAVGIIGDGPVNLLYFGVLAVGIVGTVIVHFQPQGMFRVLLLTACAQALVPIIALIGWGSRLNWSPGIAGVFGLNGFFALLFVISALLFQRAAGLSQHAPVD